MAELVIENLQIRFPDTPQAVLDIPALRVAAGSLVAVMGPSGSGKTTLVNALSGMDHSGVGSVRWGSQDIRQLSEAGRDRWRGKHVGLVMQDFHLFSGLSALENVLLPPRFSHWRLPAALKNRAHDLLQQVGLATGHRPVDVLSRGEKQRVAIARALLNAPQIVIADEPTASLDADSGEQVGELLVTLARQHGATLVAITHDRGLARRMARCLQLEKGRIVADNPLQEEAQ
ncbi:ABC transporter ATP-binding protein [Entomohabitans teleogrylli]|uniref:ABC transporter ATP-binding protein n=1 Tax=Entomohabitans teleogrylli TaxID=1384589 RepID=UPI00073D7273|nr:ABC transporter ATP-binding protein [Entomohabitans teleogrylli]